MIFPIPRKDGSPFTGCRLFNLDVSPAIRGSRVGSGRRTAENRYHGESLSGSIVISLITRDSG